MKHHRLVAAALCLALLLTLGTGVSGAFAAKDAELLPGETLTLDAPGTAEQYQWQIHVMGDVWANIAGETAPQIRVSYAMLANLLQDGAAEVRCRMMSGTAETTGEPIRITVRQAEEPMLLAAQQMPAGTVLTETQAEGAPIPMAEEGLTSHTITIEYRFADETLAANPWTATIAAGEGFAQTVRSPVILGYTARQELVELNYAAVTQDETIVVYYDAATVQFTVHHLLQNVMDDGYSLVADETRDGVTGQAVGAGLAHTYDGTYALLYDTATQIAADGSTEVQIFYDRLYYLMTFDLDGGYGVEPVYARYGAPVSVGTPTKPGYGFAGWDSAIPAEMPATDTSYRALWSAETAEYSVVFWFENADDGRYSAAQTISVAGAAPGSTASSADYQNQKPNLPEAIHMEYDAARAETVTVAGDGSTVLNVYFRRRTYTLRFFDLTCGRQERPWHTHDDTCYTEIASITAKYDAKIAEQFRNAPFSTTYQGRAWLCTEDGKYSYALQTLDRMPGFDADFRLYNKSSNTEKTICYYVQKVGANVSSTRWPTSTADFALLKQVKTYFNYATYDEEYHEIDGFTRYSANVAGFWDMRKDFANNAMNLYYLRNSYTLQFLNHSALVEEKTATVQYEAPLDRYQFVPEYPENMEQNAYRFAGWYRSELCADGTEVDWNSDTMPAGNLLLYAKWVPVTHVLRTHLTKDSAEVLETIEAAHGEPARTAVTPEREGYTFVNWFYLDGDGTEHAFDFSMPVTRDLELYAKWSSNTLRTYRIHYQLADGTAIAPDLTGSALAGSTKTFAAKAGEELDSGYRSGYFPVTNSHSITMELEEAKNVFTFVYVPLQEVNYTVRYLAKEDGRALLEERHVTTANAVVTEKFEAITGYVPDAYQKRLALSATEDENVITFWYEQDAFHAPLRIVHWVQNTMDDGYTEYQAVTNLDAVIGRRYEEAALTIPGFSYQAEKSRPAGVLTEKGLVLELFYDRIEYPYAFRFLEQGTERELAAAVMGTARYQAQVRQEAPDIRGYRLISEAEQTVTIARTDGTDDTRNVRTFYYQKATADLTIRKTVVGAVDSGQSFVFCVTAADGSQQRVVIEGSGEVTLHDLPFGTYTVTEETAWSWRYTPAQAELRVSVTAGGENLASFTNTRTNGRWLSGSAAAVNLWERVEQTATQMLRAVNSIFA